MPDWAPVPNLPSVQATVASAQPAHLSGVDHIDPDGFGRGFNSVMNMRKTLGEMELGKLIQQATDDKGVIHWDQFNSLAKKGSPNLRLLLGDYAPRVQSMEDAQSDHATEIANQSAANDMLYKKGLIDKNQHDANQSTLEARRISGGIPFTGQNSQAYIDAGQKTMVQHVTNVNDGENNHVLLQNLNGQIKDDTLPNYLSPYENAAIQTHILETQSTQNNDKTTTYSQPKATPKGNVYLNPLDRTKASEGSKSDIYSQNLQQANKKLADFNINQNNLLRAISLLHQSENETSKTPELSRLGQMLGMNVKDNETAPMLASKYMAQVEKELSDSGNSNSVAALEVAKKALGENAPYKVMALAAMAEYENEIADALKYATAQNTKDYNGYDQVYNKQILPNIMHYAQAIAYKKLNKFDPKAATAWGDTLYSIHGKQFGSNLNNALNAINEAIKNPKDRRIYNIANSMGYPMQ